MTHQFVKIKDLTPQTPTFSFRYPTDKEGNNPLEDIKHINVRHLAEYMKAFSDAMDNASFLISVYLVHKNEMNAYY